MSGENLVSDSEDLTVREHPQQRRRTDTPTDSIVEYPAIRIRAIDFMASRPSFPRNNRERPFVDYRSGFVVGTKPSSFISGRPHDDDFRFRLFDLNRTVFLPSQNIGNIGNKIKDLSRLLGQPRIGKHNIWRFQGNDFLRGIGLIRNNLIRCFQAAGFIRRIDVIRIDF